MPWLPQQKYVYVLFYEKYIVVINKLMKINQYCFSKILKDAVEIVQTGISKQVCHDCYNNNTCNVCTFFLWSRCLRIHKKPQK